MSTWIKIDKSAEMPPELFDPHGPTFLLRSDYGLVWVGSFPFDYYDDDAVYWCPMPTMPQSTPGKL